jgi:hypothetical protein
MCLTRFSGCRNDAGHAGLLARGSKAKGMPFLSKGAIMASQSFLPTADQDFNAFAVNMSALITLAPTTYGLVVGDATALATLVTSFTSSLATATNPPTRTSATVAAKNTARAVLTVEIRALAKRIQATPSVTPAQKITLGLTVPDHVRTPNPPPTTKPVASVANMGSRSLSIRLVDETTPTKRAKPHGVDGAEVYTYVPTASEAPPADLTDWRFEGIAKKSDFDISYKLSDVGKTAVIRARWISTRGDNGPVSDPITGSIAA